MGKQESMDDWFQMAEVEKGNVIDKDTGCYHIAQCAWNAIAMLHFKLKEYNNNKTGIE